MRFVHDKITGYHLDTPSGADVDELRTIIAEQYHDELKELGEEAFKQEVDRTIECILISMRNILRKMRYCALLKI